MNYVDEWGIGDIKLKRGFKMVELCLILNIYKIVR